MNLNGKEEYHVTDPNQSIGHMIVTNQQKHFSNLVTIYGKLPSKRIHIAKPTSKNYSSPESLCKELNRTLQEQQVSFSIDEVFTVQTLPNNFKLVMKNGMNYVMGYKSTELKRVGDTAEFRADLKRGTTGMMIYCSLCQFSLVGDSHVPLLRIAHLPNNLEHGAVVNQICNPPIYIPVSRGGIVNTIEVDLRTDSGEEFPLSNDGKVILTLHFRKSINKH